MKNSKNKTLTKGEMKKILGGNGPDPSIPLCRPRECEIPLPRRCDDRSCPPLYPDL